MKKSTLVALLLVLALSFTFAGKGYIDEKYGASYKVKSGYEFVADANADVAVGFATNSESFDIAAGLDVNGTVTRNRLAESSLAADFDVNPYLDINLDFGTFNGEFEFDVDGEIEKKYTVGSGSAILKALDIDAVSYLEWLIPVKNRRNYFGINNNTFVFYTKSQFLGELGVYATSDLGFSYYIPRAKADAVNAYTHSSRDVDNEYNDFDFVLSADLDITFDSYAGEGMSLLQEGSVFASYYLPFSAKDNVMTFSVAALEASPLAGEAEKYFITCGLTEIRYDLKFDRGTNAHDYFDLSAGVSALASLKKDSAAQKLNASIQLDTDAEVYVPRIVPVELLDNFSLAVPAEFDFRFGVLRATGYAIEPHLSYDVTLYPFYWEIKKGAMLLNMYMNSVELKAKFGESYRGATFARSARDLNVTATLSLDPVMGSADNAAAFSAAFDMDMIKHRKSVTISFGAEF